MAERVDTRTRILDESLRLFAVKGFEATSVSDIAGAVGIKAPSLYKHFAGKQAIFDALVAREIERHDQVRRSLDGGFGDYDKDAAVYASKTPTGMGDFAVALFDHWVTGDAAQFRRMLSTERLRSLEISELYKRMFVTDPIEYQAQLFARFIEAGLFEVGNPQTLAVQFWGPLFFLMEAADHENDLASLRDMVRNHVVSFGFQHGKEVHHA